jgi:Fic family protein
MLHTLTLDVMKSTEIEGEILNADQVRSSIARRLGVDVAGLVPADRKVEGVVQMMLDATQNYDQPLTKERLLGWHAALFPTGYSGMHKITVANWRKSEEGPMQVVSGAMGKEKIHFEAPQTEVLEIEMNVFLQWFNDALPIDPVLKSALAHLWFVTIHPFDDGNGRIARAIADMQLARTEESQQRFYSMSAQIRKERNAYYKILEDTQKGTLDITAWLLWFLSCLERALIASSETLAAILTKAHFWNRHAATTLNDRQRLMLNKLLDGFEGKLTTSKWAKIVKVSADTALRDIQDLANRGILVKDTAGGRSTGYLLNNNAENF